MKPSIFIMVIFSVVCSTCSMSRLSDNQKACEQANMKACSAQAKTRILAGVGQKYYHFLNQFGQEDIGNIQEEMNDLFSTDVIKKVNGSIIASNRAELYDQMREAKKGIKTWTVTPVRDCLINAETETIAAHFEISTPNQGTLVVMNYLECVFVYSTDSAKGLITEIDEVFNTKK